MKTFRIMIIGGFLAGCAANPPPPPPVAAQPPVAMTAPPPPAPSHGHFPSVALFNAWYNPDRGSPKGYDVYIYVLTNVSVPIEIRRALYNALTCTTRPAGSARRQPPARGVVLFPHRGPTRSSQVTTSALLADGGYSYADANDLMAELKLAGVLPSIAPRPVYLAIRGMPMGRDTADTVVYDLAGLSASELSAWLLAELNALRTGEETTDSGMRSERPEFVDTVNDVGYRAAGWFAHVIPVSLVSAPPDDSCEGNS